MKKNSPGSYDYKDKVISSREGKSRGVSHTKAPSLEMIRNEVKAALSKVSSSVELG